MPTIFVSYSRHDSNITQDFAESLRREGYTVWTDVSGIPGGAVWLFEIETAITNCDTFIVMISRNAKESQWVRREYLFALDLKKRIIPICIEDVTLPFALYDLQPINHFMAPNRALSELRAVLDHKLDPATTPASEVEHPKPLKSEGFTLVDFRRHLLAHPDEET